MYHRWEKLIDDIEELHDKYLYDGVTYTPKPPQIEELEKWKLCEKGTK